MAKIINYTIANGETQSDLFRAIEKFIKSGWQPFGGICVAYEGHKEMFFQAMVKYE